MSHDHHPLSLYVEVRLHTLLRLWEVMLRFCVTKAQSCQPVWPAHLAEELLSSVPMSLCMLRLEQHWMDPCSLACKHGKAP